MTKREHFEVSSVPGVGGAATYTPVATKYGLPMTRRPDLVIEDFWLVAARDHVLKAVKSLTSKLRKTGGPVTVTLQRGVVETTQWPDGATRDWSPPPTGYIRLPEGTDWRDYSAKTFASDGRLLVIIEVGEWDLRQAVDEIIDDRINVAIREKLEAIANGETSEVDA